MSVTTTVCRQVVVLPLASCTVQVTVLVPTGKLGGASLVTVSAPPQLSVGTRFPRFTFVAAHAPLSAATLICAGHVVITGGSVSVTTTVWTQVAALPPASCAVQVTRLVPTGKLAGASFVMVTAPPQLSVATGVPRETLVAPHKPGEATTVTRAGQEIVGGVVSIAQSMDWLHEAELPQPSVATQVSVRMYTHPLTVST